MKKILSALFVFLLFFTSFSPAQAASFNDVSNYKEEIAFLTDQKIITGYEDGSFKPAAPLKRINAVQMILREKGITDFTAPDPNFTDLRPGNYGYAEVAKAVQLGFISGKTAKDGSRYFDAGGTLTRGQMAKILTEAYNLTANKGLVFSDVNLDHWARTYVSRLATANITTGYEDGTFKPESKLQRQHFAVFMARLLNDAFKPGDMYVTFLSVGQGESVLIEYPNGKNALVDAGPSASAIEQALRDHGVTKIDTFIAANPDENHIGGAAYVIENYGVTKVIDSGQTRTTTPFIDYLDMVDRVGATSEIADIGDNLSDDPSVTANVLYAGSSASDSNAGSIGFMLSHREIDYLMMGKTDLEIEKKLIENYSLDAEILKVGYSSLSTSTSQAFLDAVNPSDVVLAFGDDPYSQPHSDVMDRLKASGAALYTTTQEAVMFSDNGFALTAHDYEITPPPKPPSPYDPYYTLRIVAKDVVEETVTIKNTSPVGQVNLGGWKLKSVIGEQTFIFPEGFVLRSGQSVTIMSGPNALDNPPSYLKWTNNNVWNNYGDEAQLYDFADELMQRFP